MKSVTSKIAEISSLIDNKNFSAAEPKVSLLIEYTSVDELKIHISDIEGLIDRFFNKRNRNLRKQLSSKLGHNLTPKNSDCTNSKQYCITDLHRRLQTELAELSKFHIFQWSTYYRDYFNNLFKDLTSILRAYTNKEDILKCITSEISDHSFDIFKKGYEYSTSTNISLADTHTYAINKSLGGLQKFLELQIEINSTTFSTTLKPEMASPLRMVTSAILQGIIAGYGRIQFNGEQGWQVFSKYSQQWVHFVPFLSHESLAVILEQTEDGIIKTGVGKSVLPITHAIDNLLLQDSKNYVLPRMSQFFWETKKINITLEIISKGISTKPIEIQCFLDSDSLHLSDFTESIARGAKLICAPLSNELRQQCESDDILRHSILDSSIKTNIEIATKAQAILNFAISKEISYSSSSEPIEFNFAKDFPLHNPFLAKYFHVYRSSVRELLRSFEHRNGVRLWCSVRRSGKTTACFDLSATSNYSIVVSQTCENTDQIPNASLFYDSVIEALASGRQISNDFFTSLVFNCGISTKSDSLRYVFVLDEYETLFERLRLAAQRDEELKYTLVRPLLNQMVSFSKNNLLVFIGQRPDAHYILMDQNQLSAYVQQDSFPLFVHNTSDLSSEFCELLRKIFTEAVIFDPSFADSFYTETSGHPFLTVKLAVLFFDWLIENKRPINKLHLTSDDFSSFAKYKLTSKSIGLANEYEFFKHAISEAIGPNGMKSTPWLHYIYSVMKQIVIDNPKSFRCTYDDFERIVSSLNAKNSYSFTPEQLLTTGVAANFFSYNNKFIGPKIKLLARIALIANPKSTW
jgi:hypothetical protein